MRGSRWYEHQEPLDLPGVVTSEPPHRLPSPRRPRHQACAASKLAGWNRSSDPIPDPAEAVSVGRVLCLPRPAPQGETTTNFRSHRVPHRTSSVLHRQRPVPPQVASQAVEDQHDHAADGLPVAGGDLPRVVRPCSACSQCQRGTPEKSLRVRRSCNSRGGWLVKAGEGTEIRSGIPHRAQALEQTCDTGAVARGAGGRDEHGTGKAHDHDS